MKRKVIVQVILLVIIFSGCASTPKPTSNVGIVNGKYAVQTTVPNNNKGKKVDITAGQSYKCAATNNKGDVYSFDLKANSDRKSLLTYNDSINGKLSKGSYTGRFVHKPKYGFVETTKGNGVVQVGSDKSGRVALYMAKKDVAAKRGIVFQCTQTTNNTYYNTRYLTNHDISAYQHNQQVAIQQRAINDANYNASMARMQAQSAQTNYSTQQMLNRMNTYNVKVY